MDYLPKNFKVESTVGHCNRTSCGRTTKRPGNCMTAATDRGRLDQCRSQAVPRRNSLVCPATEYCGLTISTRDASNRSKGLRYAEQTEITVISGEARLHASATVSKCKFIDHVFSVINVWIGSQLVNSRCAYYKVLY